MSNYRSTSITILNLNCHSEKNSTYTATLSPTTISVKMANNQRKANILSAYRKLLKLSDFIKPEKKRIEIYNEIRERFRKQKSLEDEKQLENITFHYFLSFFSPLSLLSSYFFFL